MVIVGLGNPGEQYKNTRHNAGWLFLDDLLGDVHWTENKKLNALLFEQGGMTYVKPLTFMNNSGQAVQKILNYYKLLPKRFGLIGQKDSDLTDVLTVIHDDLDLDFGTYKVATDSGSAGNNGVQSIIDYLKTKKFRRLRIGIKNEHLRVHIPPDRFVLSQFSSDERKKLTELFPEINSKLIKQA